MHDPHEQLYIFIYIYLALFICSSRNSYLFFYLMHASLLLTECFTFIYLLQKRQLHYAQSILWRTSGGEQQSQRRTIAKDRSKLAMPTNPKPRFIIITNQHQHCSQPTNGWHLGVQPCWSQAPTITPTRAHANACTKTLQQQHGCRNSVHEKPVINLFSLSSTKLKHVRWKRAPPCCRVATHVSHCVVAKSCTNGSNSDRKNLCNKHGTTIVWCAATASSSSTTKWATLHEPVHAQWPPPPTTRG